MSRRGNRFDGREWVRSTAWSSGAALLALTPKCLVCVAAYLGLGATLGVTRPEICGGSSGNSHVWMLFPVSAGAIAVVIRRLRTRHQPPLTLPPLRSDGSSFQAESGQRPKRRWSSMIRRTRRVSLSQEYS